MATERDILREIRQRLALMRDELDGYTVYLFGSRAMGTANKRSDFDIGIDGDRPLSARVFYRISDMFDEIRTLHRIDWVDLHETSAAFRSEALKNALVLYG
ncbi:MAG: nucleotidyltransferase domain-containing protein [Lentisphaerae bacterium]|nr:nucleotidyltransferase domain-containing protein [Lentisphaerota bacterium]